MQNNTKMITVDSRGMVSTSRGRIMSPIRTPYRETCDRIWGMLTQDRAEITEHLESGKKVKLTVDNFDADNSGEKKEEPAAPQQQAAPADGGAKVVSDIEQKDAGVPMRTGETFFTNPAAQMEATQEPEKKDDADNSGEKKEEPAAPQQQAAPAEAPKPQNNQQQNNNNNGGKNGKNKHNKGNNNQQNQQQNAQKQEQKQDAEKKEDVPATPDTADADKKEDGAVEEKKTGADLSVSPEEV